MRLGIIGSRGFPNRFMVEESVRRIARQYPDATIVSGGADGVDTWAVSMAKACGLQTTVFLPDFDQYGTDQAYSECSAQIAGRSDALLAFWDGRSTGTLDTLRKAKSLGKNVRIVMADGRSPIPSPV